MPPIPENNHKTEIVVAIVVALVLGLVFALPRLVPAIPSFISDLGSEIEKRSAKNPSGSCKMLQEEYCKGAALGQAPGEQENYAYVGFRLPQGTMVFAPWSGNVNARGFSLINPKATVLTMILDVNGNKKVDPAEDISFSATGDLEVLAEGNVSQGTPIALVRDTGIVLFEDYNLFVDVSRYDAEKKFFVPDADLMKEWFPALFK